MNNVVQMNTNEFEIYSWHAVISTNYFSQYDLQTKTCSTNNNFMNNLVVSSMYV
jgi:hypothetical protein